MASFSSTSAATFVVNGVSVAAGSSPAPIGMPPSLIATRAVEMKAGWIGQLIVAGDVIWESKPKKTSKEAEEQATQRVVERLKSLLS